MVAVDRGRYTCVVDSSDVTAMRARELGRKSVVVGDRVSLVGDTSGVPGALARIVRISERTSVLRRTADDDDSTPEGRLERVVVANADQLVIVSSLADPPPRTGFIDRCLVAAYDADIEPLLCLTKADLATPDGVLDYYAELDLRHVLCRPDASLDDLLGTLTDRISVLVGHSGVGKSTLVNRIVPDADRAVGVVSAIGKGRHTSSSAVALRLPADEPSWIIDTPGYGASASPTSPRTACCTASPTWSRGPSTARPTASTPAPRRTARWTPGSPRGTPTRAGSSRTAGCWPPGILRPPHSLRCASRCRPRAT
ncbi:hypothetical protein Prum_032010 [Phytohabitans rumicis]|uniref:EngC GTPase domain-containing protein n=1 Tax=Phytohabitans rumicis TaxID=1076125 RepID=A0A6V8L4K9_9ACTN|nr:hypothetical protein Prum_032010 [Phytohabitans rumicis]